MLRLPGPYEDFKRRFPKVLTAHERVGAEAAKSGPLPPKVQHLIKLGMALGIRSEGAVHSHARRALEAGATKREIEHVTALAVATLGFPTAVAGFTWVRDIASAKGRPGRK